MRPRNSKGKKDFNKSGDSNTRKSGAKPKRFSKAGDKPFRGKRASSSDEREEKPFRKRESSGGRPTFKSEEGKPFREKKSGDFSDSRKPYAKDKKYGRKSDTDGERSEKPYWKKEGYNREKPGFSSTRGDNSDFNRTPYDKEDKKVFSSGRKSSRKKNISEEPEKKSRYGEEKAPRKKKGYEGRRRKNEPLFASSDGLTRLNKYLANSGICSRREADDLIKSGVVSVNGKPVTEMGYKVSAADEVKYNGESMKKERMVYVLLNKPKDFITTLDDPRGRKTVLELVRKAGRERIYPVGRLDRNTTGVLLLTNDGELTARLTHPKYGVKKMYHVSLDKNFKTTDFEKLTEGVTLEDGFVKPDVVSFVGDGSDKRDIGIEIHSGKNRIVRRMFEHLGYEVVKLDRVLFASLTKKDLPRGRWRFLSDKEVAFLKMVPKSA